MTVRIMRDLTKKNSTTRQLDMELNKLLPTLFFMIISLVVIGQTSVEKMKMGKKADLLKEMDKGVVWMDNGDYVKADEKFNYVLKTMEVIPANLAFYVGKNSLLQDKYKQSIDWLNKYIQLKGTKGQYYFESVKLLEEAEQKYNSLSQADRQIVMRLDSLINSNEIDCGPSGLVVCPVCKGRTVIIESGKLGDIYRPCPYSDNSGFLTCPEYNLLLQGKLKAKF